MELYFQTRYYFERQVHDKCIYIVYMYKYRDITTREDFTLSFASSSITIKVILRAIISAKIIKYET